MALQNTGQDEPAHAVICSKGWERTCSMAGFSKAVAAEGGDAVAQSSSTVIGTPSDAAQSQNRS
jgi:hypothetical protein